VEGRIGGGGGGGMTAVWPTALAAKRKTNRGRSLEGWRGCRKSEGRRWETGTGGMGIGGEGDGDVCARSDEKLSKLLGPLSQQPAAAIWELKISICIGTNHDILSQPARTAASPPISRPDHPIRSPRPRHSLLRAVAFQMMLRMSVDA